MLYVNPLKMFEYVLSILKPFELKLCDKEYCRKNIIYRFTKLIKVIGDYFHFINIKNILRTFTYMIHTNTGHTKIYCRRFFNFGLINRMFTIVLICLISTQYMTPVLSFFFVSCSFVIFTSVISLFDFGLDHTINIITFIRRVKKKIVFHYQSVNLHFC